MKTRDEDDGWDMFLDLCLQAKDLKRLHGLFNLLFTIEEKEHLDSRMQIIKALLDGKLSQREISDRMKVSISQITRGSNALKIIDRELLKFLVDYVRKHK